MATIQEMQQARDLMKNQWIPLADAVAKVRTPVTPTSQINQDQFAKNQAERQANPIVPPTPVTPTPNTPVQPTVTGVDGQKFVQAPIDQSTGLSTPQAQVTTPIQSEVKSQEPVKTDIASSIQPIDKNAEIQAKNEAQMALNKQKAQIASEDRQRQAEEARIASIPTDAKWILNTLISGGSVTTQNTPEYRSANYKHRNYQKFNTMTPSQLLDNMKMWEIDTETSQLLSQNPNYIQAKNEWDKIQKNNSVNAMIKSAYGWISGKSEEVDYYNKSASEVAKRLGVNETNAEAYSRIVGKDPLVNQLTQTVSSTAKQLNQLNNERNQAYKELKAQYPAMDTNSLMVLMWSRTQDVTDQIKALNSTLSLTQADLKSAMEIAKGEYDATSQDIQARQDMSKEQRQVQAQKDMMQYQSDFQKKQAEQALNDPATAIQTAFDEYKKLGIPLTSTVQSHLAEFKKSGKSLPDYLTQMRENIQASPAFKKYESLQNGQMSDAQKVASSQNFDMKKMWMEQNFQMKLAQAKNVTNNKWTKLDDWLYTNENGKIMTADELKSAKLMGNSYITKQVGEEWGDCGFYASRGTGLNSTPGGNSKDARIQAFSDPTPQVGWMALFTGSGYDQTYGHISIVTGVNPDGTINVKESNYGNDKRVTERTLPASSVTGYYNKTPLAQWAGASGWNYEPIDITVYNSMSPTDKKKTQNDPKYRAFLWDYNKVMTDKNAPIEDILRFSSWQSKMWDSESKSLDKFSQALQQISTMEEQIRTMDTWPILGRLRSMNPYDTNAQVLKAQLQALIPNLARGVYGEVWVLTDNDIANYAKTIPNLSSTQDVNKAILSMTLKTMWNGYKSQLQALASAKNDVSWYGWLYNQYMDMVNSLDGGSQVSKTSTSLNDMYTSFESLYNK